MKTFKLRKFASIVATSDIDTIIASFDALCTDSDFQSIGWVQNFAKLRSVLHNGIPQYSIFTEGNSKLPFYSFSALPGVTCPGAGACLDFCYSFRAWRYPAAFMRQVQNTFLLRFHRDSIAQAFAKLPDNVDFRLYVDGDFSSVDDVTFWMGQLSSRPSIRGYGYSKSFDELLSYDGAWPSNYMLNLSSGHRHNADTLERVRKLPIVRGEFIAVSIGRKIKSNEHGTAPVVTRLREVFKNKAFPCPGKCGSCTGKGHACGLPQLKGLPIIIAMH